MLQCKAMTEATLSAKNQIRIPREAREALRLKPGDKILVVSSRREKDRPAKAKVYHAAIRGLGSACHSKAHLQKERQSWG